MPGLAQVLVGEQPVAPETAHPEPLKEGVLANWTLASDISGQPVPLLLTLPASLSAPPPFGLGPSAKAHTLLGSLTNAMAWAGMLTVVKPSTAAKYAGCCWLKIGRAHV